MHLPNRVDRLHSVLCSKNQGSPLTVDRGSLINMELYENDPEFDDTDSLFGIDETENTDLDPGSRSPAMTSLPPIPGLFMFPRLLPEDTACTSATALAFASILTSHDSSQAHAGDCKVGHFLRRGEKSSDAVHLAG